jgi:outer membrane lipoprotein carrier protein
MSLLNTFRQQVKWLLLVVAIFVFNTAMGAEADDIVKKVQKKYQSAKSIRIQFKEISRFKLTGTMSEVDAILQMEGKDKFRLESEDQVLVNDGETFWRYNKLDNQVLVDYSKKDDQEILLNNFLYEVKDHYFAQIVEETKEGGDKIFVLRLTPKPSEQSIFTSIKVWIKDNTWEIKRLIYTDYNDNETEYEIEKIEFDPKLADSTFTFSPPEGIQVIDLRL